MAETAKLDDNGNHQPAKELMELDEGDIHLPTSWMYKPLKFGPLDLNWYASPKFQLGMVALVCFLCPGMFNALGGLGGGGKTDPTLADNMNVALYSTFAVFGFFGGSVVNWLGVRITLSIAGLGYCIYIISLLVSVHADVPGFNIFAGALLGICAGLLWTAQGAIMLSYPRESEKGRYFAWFWSIFALGGVMGSLIPLAQSIDHKTAATVTDGTYIGFIVLTFAGSVLAAFLCNAGKVIRSDGTGVIVMKHPTWKTELIGLYETPRYDPYILTLFPMFWASNWFVAYQANAVNAAYFDTRTRALNGLLNNLAGVFLALLMGHLLDYPKLRRRVKAKIAWFALLVLTIAVWGGSYAWQKGYTRETVSPESGFVAWDWTTPGYVEPMFLYFFFGVFDTAWQCVVYWFIGALSNSGRKSANIAGFYKGIQSAGAAVMWSLDSNGASFEAELISNWVLLAGSLVCAAPVIFWKIKDHITIEEDIQFTDETIQDVLRARQPYKESGSGHDTANQSQ